MSKGPCDGDKGGVAEEEDLEVWGSGGNVLSDDVPPNLVDVTQEPPDEENPDKEKMQNRRM